MHNDITSHVHPILELEDAESYSITYILFLAASLKHPCENSKNIHDCATLRSRQRGANRFTCSDQCTKNQIQHDEELDYLTDRLFRLIAFEIISLFDETIHRTIHPNLVNNEAPIGYTQAWFFIRKAKIQKADLFRFYEKLRIKINLTKLTKTDQQPETKTTHDQAELSSIEQIDQKSDRHDRLSLEIDEIMCKNNKTTGTQLIKILLNRIGRQDTCVVCGTGDGIKWEDSNGEQHMLRSKGIDNRIYRWRQKTKLNYQ